MQSTAHPRTVVVYWRRNFRSATRTIRKDYVIRREILSLLFFELFSSHVGLITHEHLVRNHLQDSH